MNCSIPLFTDRLLLPPQSQKTYLLSKNWQPREGANFVIVRQNDDRVIGSISYKDIDRKHRRAEFGYWIGKPFLNNGYATEAIKALMSTGLKN